LESPSVNQSLADLSRVGEGVHRVKPSDRVAFTGLPGADAEAMLADAERLIPLPEEFSFEEGAAFALQDMTALLETRKTEGQLLLSVENAR
jgi:NADPH2:quinone reductase